MLLQRNQCCCFEPPVLQHGSVPRVCTCSLSLGGKQPSSPPQPNSPWMPGLQLKNLSNQGETRLIFSALHSTHWSRGQLPHLPSPHSTQ